MQIEALQWAIAREEKIGFTDDKHKELHSQPLQEKLKELKGSIKTHDKPEI